MSLHLRTQHSINVVAKQKGRTESAAKPGRKAVAKEAVVDPETGLVTPTAGKSYSKKKRRDIWQHFEVFPEDNSRARCKICREVVVKGGKAIHASFIHYLIPHLNQHGLKLEVETCSVCGQTFNSKEKRRKHETIHKEKSLPCSHCGKMFRSKQQRENHERIHTGEKPFQVCLSTYNISNLFMIFIAVHRMRQEVCEEEPADSPHASAHRGDKIPL